jgi:hypothetical protein
MGADPDDEIEVEHHRWDDIAHQSDLKHQGEIAEEPVDAEPDSLFDDEKPEADPGVGSYGLSRDEISS